jgi:hypothetical protein
VASTAGCAKATSKVFTKLGNNMQGTYRLRIRSIDRSYLTRLHNNGGSNII